MEVSERTSLLHSNAPGLCVTFAIICIVDVFGVFPIVSLPKPVIDCGYYGIVVVTFICVLQIYTAILLGRCWTIAEHIQPNIRNKYRYPYSALAEFTYGKYFSVLVTVLVDLTIFSGGIPNLILASQNLQFLGLRLSNESFDMSYCYWMIIMGTLLCPFLWFGSPKDMKLLCTISVTIVILVFTLCFGCILLDTQSATVFNDFNEDLWQKIVSAYSILVFQFDIHPTILSIQVDMTKRSKIDQAIIGGFLVSLSLFFVTTVTVLTKYGNNLTPNILQILPNSTILYFAVTLVAIQLSLTSAISNTALYQHVEDFMKISKEFNKKRCLLRSCLTFLGILIAESVPRFDIVMSLIGGALTGPLVFIFPPLLYVKVLQLKRVQEEVSRVESFQKIVYDVEEINLENLNQEFKTEMSATHNNFEISICYLIILFGSIASVVATYWNIKNTLEYVTFSPPCIFNIYNITI